MAPPHTINIPWRHRIHHMPSGTKQIHISLNGHLAIALEYDPKADTLQELELQPSALETKPATQPDTQPYMKHG